MSTACPARFCNRLCLKRSEKTHPLLCPAQNPASVSLLAFARKHAWMALHALAQCTARLLLAHQQKQGRQRAGSGGGGGGGGGGEEEEEGMREDWSVYCALADLGMEERVKGGWCVCICVPASPSYLWLWLCFLATLLALKVARHGARSRYMAGCAPSFHAGVCGATRYGSAEKTCKIVEAASTEGRHGRAVHV
jgi:hypothetical protein